MRFAVILLATLYSCFAMIENACLAQSATTVERSATLLPTGSRAFVGDSHALRDGPSASHAKRINEKSTRIFGETHYLNIGTSVVLVVLENKNNWTKVQVVDPGYLSASHVGWVPSSALSDRKQKSADELKMDRQLECCGREAGTRPLLRADKLIAKLAKLGLSQTNVEWKKANFDPGWIAIILKLWPDPLEWLTPQQRLAVNPAPPGPNEVNCQVIGPNRDSVSVCIVEAELRRKESNRESLMLAAKVMKAVDPSISKEILLAFVNRKPTDYGRWTIRTETYPNGEVSVYADYDCSRLLTAGRRTGSKH